MYRFEIKIVAKFGIIIPITLMTVMIVKLRAPATKNVTENQNEGYVLERAGCCISKKKNHPHYPEDPGVLIFLKSIGIFIHPPCNGIYKNKQTNKVIIKFIYSEKATKFCEVSTIDLMVSIYDKSMVEILEILQKFVAFSEYMNFTLPY